MRFAMTSRKSIPGIYLYFKSFYGGQKLHKSFRSLLIKDTSLLICSYIGELRNSRKFEREDKPFIVFILTLEQPIMRIEDRLFNRGWVRSAMATRKCENIYFGKYFMAVKKFTNIFVLLLILMVGSRDTLFLVCFT